MGEVVFGGLIEQGRCMIDGRIDVTVVGKRIAPADRQFRVGFQAG